ncbi:LysR family transcriptional regulator [Oceaniradius stylonematis]|jgi:molybdate transport repressor ModE-like protein|uniref:LysR family transcriptional regulator n=1 Tax=Oceaniradius stylonematis TaxID=2184161 RepID=UPI0035CF6916
MTRSLDRLTLLETFVRIAERGSISAAARDLGLSQASASRQLADLEERLGAQLIVRSTHHLSLTKAGERCLADARLLLAEWEGFAEDFAGDADRIAGPLKIVVPVALGQTVALDCAVAFQAAHPEIVLDWILDDAPIRFSEVGCDLWLRVGAVPDETLIVQPLAEVERIVVAAPGLVGPADGDPQALANVPCAALHPFEGGRWPLTGPLGETADLDARVTFASNNIATTKRVAVAGGGYAIMPRWLVAAELEAGTLVEPLPGWRAASLTINAAFAPARRQTRRLRLFIDAMKDGLAGLA